jgi:hypothetical protein
VPAAANFEGAVEPIVNAGDQLTAVVSAWGVSLSLRELRSSRNTIGCTVIGGAGVCAFSITSVIRWCFGERSQTGSVLQPQRKCQAAA